MRFARIMPCLLALLFLLSILHILKIKGFIIKTTTLTQALFSALSFHINWLEAKTGYLPASWDILWSLSIEEVFYLLFPIACLLAKKLRYFILLMLIFIILGPFSRVAFSNNEIWSDHAYLSCIDGIAVGSLCALASHYIRLNQRLVFSLFALGTSSFLFVFFMRSEVYALGLTELGINISLLELSCGLLLIAAQERYLRMKSHSKNWFLGLKILGRNSYEIYLSHMFIVIIAARFLYNPRQPVSLIIFFYFLSILFSGLIGQLIAYYFSLPMNRKIRHSFNKTPATS